MPTLQQRIEIAMRQVGVSQTQIAEACGISVPSVNGWASGKTKSLKADTAIKAAAFLGVNPAWLAEGRGPMLSGDLKDAVVLSPQESRLLLAFNRLDHKDQARFVAEAEYKAALADIDSTPQKNSSPRKRCRGERGETIAGCLAGEIQKTTASAKKSRQALSGGSR